MHDNDGVSLPCFGWSSTCVPAIVTGNMVRCHVSRSGNVDQFRPDSEKSFFKERSTFHDPIVPGTLWLWFRPGCPSLCVGFCDVLPRLTGGSGPNKVRLDAFICLSK
jgi:hypothetical protein